MLSALDTGKLRVTRTYGNFMKIQFLNKSKTE